MSRKKRKHKKRACKNIVNNYYIITNSKADDKVTISQKITLISATITLIIVIINFITKIIG